MRSGAVLAALAAAAACGDPTTTPVTQLNLDRPVDVAFACYGNMRQTDDPKMPIISTAQPLAACAALSPPLNPPDGAKPIPVPGQETLGDGVAITPAWYAFILQSASGTVALASWPSKPAEAMVGGVADVDGDISVLDADLLTPGKNAIAIGEDPVAIATDKSGCYMVTANAGSCDLSELEVNSALDDIKPVSGKPATPVRVDRVPVHNAMGALLARPAAMVAEPGATVVGNTCPATATGRVYIAYPSCHLVAGVDTATGQIVSGIAFDAAGTPTILSAAAADTLICPTECASASTAGSGASSPGPRPVALDLRQTLRQDPGQPPRLNTLRLAIGASNSPSVTVVDLDPVTSDPASPASVLQIPLDNPSGKLGVTAVALSPQIGMGGNAGGLPGESTISDDTSPAGQGQYVYAIGTDNTVHVADVLNLKKECDTQVDGRFVEGLGNRTALQCFVVGDPATPPRRSGAKGPGIALPASAVPTSVTIVKARTVPPVITDSSGHVTGTQPPSPPIWLGYFAVITATDGVAYVVNVDDDYAPDVASLTTPLASAPVLVMAHQLRDSFANRSQGPVDTPTDPSITPRRVCTTVDPPPSLGGALGGGPRISTQPAFNLPVNTLPTTLLPRLPSVQKVQCISDVDAPQDGTKNGVALSTLQFGADERTVRDRTYPDLATVLSETWSLTWEGTLSLDNAVTSIDGPSIRTGQMTVDGFGMRITDPTHPFCDMGVEPFDIAELRGCDPSRADGDCPAGYTCYLHPRSDVGIGACMLKSEAPRLTDACQEFLTSLRRYTVGRSAGGKITSGEMVLLPRRHELAAMPFDGCTSNDQCNDLAALAATVNPSADPFNPATTSWSCRPDELRAPIHSDSAKNKRCVQVCHVPKDASDPVVRTCAKGTICQLASPDPIDGSADGICMEGVEPPQACVNGPQRYDVRASEAFTVIGGTSGYVHPFIVDKTDPAGGCIRDPALANAPPVQQGRIPINPSLVPACVSGSNELTGQLPSPAVGFEPNPCTEPMPVAQFDGQSGAVVACEGKPTAASALGVRGATAVKFRNRAMMLRLVDTNQSCLLGPTATPTNVPFLIPGYQIEFAQKAGFAPLTLPLNGPTSPVKVVRGPTDSIWVIDDGDFLATSITDISTRGRVYRVESVNMNIVNLLQ